MSVFSDFSSFSDDGFSDGDFSDCSEIMPVFIHRSTKKIEASKKYNTSEELMFINCECSDTSNDKHKLIFEDRYTCQINKLSDQHFSEGIDLNQVRKEVMIHYFNSRFVTHIIVHDDEQICLPGEIFEPTYTLYVYYLPSKFTTINGEHIRKDHKWTFRAGDKSLVIKDSPDHMSSCEGIVHSDLKDELKSWFPDREYFHFQINYDYHICSHGEEMPETYTILLWYID